MSSVVLLPTAPEPPLPGTAPTLAEAERETASRVGPCFVFTATGGTFDGVFVAGLRSNAPVGGYEGLYLLRRGAAVADDRLRTVDRFDAPGGALVVDFPYADAPVAGEAIELHHLHPDQQLLADVRAGLRRCYLLDTLAVTPPTGAFEVAVDPTGRALVREVNGAPNGARGNGGGSAWLLLPPNGNGNGARGNGGGALPFVPGPGEPARRLEGGRRVANDWEALAAAPRATPGTPAAVVDLTAQAPWLVASRQVLGVASEGVVLPPAGRWGEPNAVGWTCHASRGHVYLGVPAGVPLDGLTVRAYRDAFGLVNGADQPSGPLDDDDELAVPLDYVAAFSHVEAWRRHRDRLEAAAAEGRFATQTEAAAEATRVASIWADFLFRPTNERPDRPVTPWGTDAGANPAGLGGTGALLGAVVNQSPPEEE